MVRDPVCHEPVDPDVTQWQCSYLSETWYFCSLACMEQFERNPSSYAAPALSSRATCSDGVIEDSVKTPAQSVGGGS